MDSLEPSPLEWCDSQTIQWSKINTCDLRMHSKFPWGTPLLGRSSSWATASDPRAKISWQDLAQWKCIVHQFFISLTSKKTKYPNILVSLSCVMHTSRLQGHVWQWLWLRCSLSDRPTSLGKYKKRHWLKQLSSLKSKWKFRLKPNHQFHHWDSATILQVWMMPPPWIFSACLPGLSPSVTHGQVQRCSSCVLQNP